MNLIRRDLLFVLTASAILSLCVPVSQVVAVEATESLYAALRSGEARSVRAILQREPSLVDHRGDYGFTPLMLAAFWADAATIQAVLDAGAEVDAVNDWGGQAINCVAGDLAKLKALVAAGGDIHHATEIGFKPLNAAVRDAFALDTVKYLVERGADVNHATNQGVLPVAVAADTGNLELVRYLLSHGAELPNMEAASFTAANGEEVGGVEQWQVNALSNALAAGYVDIAGALTRDGATSDNAMFAAVFYHRPKAIRFVIEELGEKELPPWALHVAAHSDFGETETIEVLLAAGNKANEVLAWAPTNAPQLMAVEESAADIAARSGDTPAKRMLVDAGGCWIAAHGRLGAVEKEDAPAPTDRSRFHRHARARCFDPRRPTIA